MELRTDQFDLRETIAAVERVMKGFAAEAKVQILSHVDPDAAARCAWTKGASSRSSSTCCRTP